MRSTSSDVCAVETNDRLPRHTSTPRGSRPSWNASRRLVSAAHRSAAERNRPVAENDLPERVGTDHLRGLVVLREQAREAAAQVVAERGEACVRRVAPQLANHGEAARGRERMAVHRAALVDVAAPGRRALEDVRAAADGRQRQAAADDLAERRHVGQRRRTAPAHRRDRAGTRSRSRRRRGTRRPRRRAPQGRSRKPGSRQDRALYRLDDHRREPIAVPPDDRRRPVEVVERRHQHLRRHGGRDPARTRQRLRVAAAAPARRSSGSRSRGSRGMRPRTSGPGRGRSRRAPAAARRTSPRAPDAANRTRSADGTSSTISSASSMAGSFRYP